MTWMSFLLFALMLLINGVLVLAGVWIGYKAGKGSELVMGMPSDLVPIEMEEDGRVAYYDEEEEE